MKTFWIIVFSAILFAIIHGYISWWNSPQAFLQRTIEEHRRKNAADWARFEGHLNSLIAQEKRNTAKLQYEQEEARLQINDPEIAKAKGAQELERAQQEQRKIDAQWQAKYKEQ